ncbi:MAG TPA: carboxypeptidase-like regulatory domain-containing protein [Puia sp.]|nr:carboxypeptidase-like regulatory domain-containing protein [Puia sp.]
MNNADKHITQWSNTDVQRYLRGELSAREMHDLEQQALDDPFLADALEGLQTQPGDTLQQDLSQLSARLDARVAPKPTAIPWRAIRVAAAVILLVGLGFTAYYILPGHKQPASIAKAKVPAPSAATNQPAPSPAPPIAANTTPPAASRERPAAKSPAHRPHPAATALPPAETRELSDSQPPIAADIARDIAPSVANVHKDSAHSLASGVNPRLVAVSGRVLDFNHRPLAGAALIYKSKGTVFTAAYTDGKGQFNLYVPQKDTTRQLTVAMPGYEETQYAFNADGQTANTIFLRQNPAQLSEVVVSGIGAKRKEFMAEPPSDNPEKLDSFWLNTAPAMGRIAYLNYLATARNTIPVDTTIHGAESISFRVDKKGALTEFRIEHSLSPAHDAGVIRLITEGPPWKMLHGRSARALVNVLF